MHSIGRSADGKVYSVDEHGTWTLLVHRQAAILAGSACRSFLKGTQALHLPANAIPRLSDVDHQLRTRTGWRIARAPGVLCTEDLFLLLSERVFPCVETIRPRRELDFTPAPDVFHGLFAGAPMLTDPSYADFLQRVARAGLAAGPGALRRVGRFYRAAMEYGLVRESHRVKIFGHAILASPEESRRFSTFNVERRRFRLPLVFETEFDPTRMRKRLFVLESFKHLVETFDRWAGSEGLI